VLFLAGEPLGSRRISQIASLADGTEARTLIRRLNRYYDSQGSAFRIEEIAGGFQLLTRPKFGGWLRRLHQAPVETRLSAPAMETLAVVAYRQAVPRAEIEAVRGVQCAEMLRQLMEKDLVRIVGRANDLGRPFLYGTTKRFLQLFGLRHVDELPRAELLRRGTGGTANDTQNETNPVARQGAELTPIDSNEESEVSIVPNPESAREDLWKLGSIQTLAAPKAEADEDDDLDDDDWDDDDDDEDDDDDLEDDDDEEDELDDEDDLEDDEWEEVDDDEEWDDDEDDDEDDDDWDDDDDEDDDDDDDDDDWEEEE